jgi:hypothetical protein
MTTNTNTNPWWIVYWSHPQTGRGAVAANGHAYIQAGDSAGADAAYLTSAPIGTVITNILGPYSTQAAAQAAASNPDLSVTGATTSGAATNFSFLPNPLDYLKGIAAFFDDLGSANLWVRVGEVVLGLMLIAVGVAKLTHAVPVATKIAGTVGPYFAAAA